jgi:hypothetical protein
MVVPAFWCYFFILLLIYTIFSPLSRFQNTVGIDLGNDKSALGTSGQIPLVFQFKLPFQS